MSEESTWSLPQDGVERSLARLTSLEDKVDQWLDLDGGLLAKNVIKAREDRGELTGRMEQPEA